MLQLKLSTSKQVTLGGKNKYIFLGSKNSRRPGGGRPQKWIRVEQFIIDKVRHAWECGVPLTPEQLHHLVLDHVGKQEDKDTVDSFVNGKRATLNKYVQRVLARHNYSVRKISISQSVPPDWRQKAQENAERIRTTFCKEKVDVVVNADETFLLFHPFGQRLIAPTGVKRVGTALQVDNEKWGATVMIACEYRTSSILPPMVIFTGVYCAKLMKHWADFDRAKVIFNESHWMTSNAAIIYIAHLLNIFNGKRIGLIWDKHTSHYSEDVLNFIKKCNEDESSKTTIILELVDEGLTPIIQVPDVAVNKVFKSGVKHRYHQYRSTLPLTVGKKVTVSREMLVDFVLETINDINNKNNETPFIAESFRRCGLNPWSKGKSLTAFQEHLDGLETNDVLRAMLTNQKAIPLLN
jgi:hypothetical protein